MKLLKNITKQLLLAVFIFLIMGIYLQRLQNQLLKSEILLQQVVIKNYQVLFSKTYKLHKNPESENITVDFQEL